MLSEDWNYSGFIKKNFLLHVFVSKFHYAFKTESRCKFKRLYKSFFVLPNRKNSKFSFLFIILIFFFFFFFNEKFDCNIFSFKNLPSSQFVIFKPSVFTALFKSSRTKNSAILSLVAIDSSLLKKVYGCWANIPVTLQVYQSNFAVRLAE